ncbi:MAG: IclR family transcriptional regulator [Caulobacterales bacterium]|nr:IclR family transcriptional regulator [Caulobacterales bacterium]
MANTKKQIQGIQSVEIGSEILFALSDAMRPLGLVEISNAVDMPPSNVRRYLVSLTRTGLVEQHERSGAYALGGRALELGMSILSQTDLLHAATDPMGRLRDELDQVVVLTIWSNAGPVIVHVKDQFTPIAIQVRVGFTLPILTSAAGLVFGAYLPRERTQKFVEKELRSARSNGDAAIRTMKHFQETREEIRGKGHATLVDPIVIGARSFGAPIYDAFGQLAGALAMLSIRAAKRRHNDEVATAKLVASATDISRALGYSKSRHDHHLHVTETS